MRAGDKRPAAGDGAAAEDGGRQAAAAARRWLVLVGPAFLVGLVLRVWDVADQVMGGDELHGVRAAVDLTPGEVLTTYGLRDYSLPLTALFSWLLRQGVALDEMAFRLPSLVAGVAAVALLPPLLARRLPGAVAAWLAWLLALSPLLVLYSRIARSYLPMTLAACAAVGAFAAWWEGRGRRWGVAYAVLATLALWLHLGAGPFLVTPFVYAGLDAMARRGGWRAVGRRLVPVLGLGVATAALWAALLAPALPSLRQLTRIKHTAGLTLAPGAVSSTLRALAGSAEVGPAVALAALAVVGLALLLRGQRSLAALTVTAVLGHLAGLLLLAPRGGGVALVLTRYLLVALPLVLLWAARGLAEPWLWPGSRRAWLARAATVALAAALFLGGPLPRMLREESAFDHHNLQVDLAAPRRHAPAALVPAAYRQLAGPFLVVPWPRIWKYGWTAPLYQEHHRQQVLVCAVGDFPQHPSLRLRNALEPDPAAFLGSRAGAVVVHLRLGAEEARLTEALGYGTVKRLTAEEQRRLRRDAGRLAGRLRRAWGRPDHADEWTVAWDLRRVRAEGPRRRGGVTGGGRR